MRVARNASVVVNANIARPRSRFRAGYDDWRAHDRHRPDAVGIRWDFDHDWKGDTRDDHE
ncbi:hypothetical protein GCM10009682_00570 [Luedemannella flava]|uniref:Uncharacterized protein n=1 Tax=Luedemannella flava TaxID=349316 RepID=A0ABP4XK68_9ACTN